jgi:putative ABC transport system ATP-binding protein
MSASIQVSGLNKVYGVAEQAVHAVKDVSFAAGPGEFLAIVGPSGSGKTTLLAMMGGLLTPTAGIILVNGKNIALLKGGRLAKYRSTSVGFVFQSNNLVPFLTARENLALLASIAGGDKRERGKRADRLLDELGLQERADALVSRLSGGERQRVAIARALVNNPDLVLVDEPTASLDSARGKQVVRALAGEVKNRDKLGIMVTHDSEMALLADRVLEMHDGRLREGRAALKPGVNE